MAEPFEGSRHDLAGSQREGVGGQDVYRGAGCLGVGGSAVTSAVSRGWGWCHSAFGLLLFMGRTSGHMVCQLKGQVDVKSMEAQAVTPRTRGFYFS